MIIDFFYNLIIRPLIFIYEIIFNISYNYLHYHLYYHEKPCDCIISIFLVSLFVNVITFPLYNNANKIQDEERILQKKIKPMINHINATFKGDEKFMMTQAYYKEQNYKPIYALRSSASLLLQIPFFTSAYIFFSNLDGLHSMIPMHLTFIKDYAKPDNLILVNGFYINALPIIMTFINLFSCLIYTKGFTLKEKLQPIALAIIFLVLLYNSPAALVIYWIFNNIFSLFKIVVEKVFIKQSTKHCSTKSTSNNISYILILFVVFLGIYIPTTLISASTFEFLNFGSNPFNIIAFTLNVFFGYAFWIFVFYIFNNLNFKTIFRNMLYSLVVVFIINYFLFPNNFGMLSPYLTFEGTNVHFSSFDRKINIIVLLVVFIFLICQAFFLKKLTKYICCILIIVFFICSFINSFKILNALHTTDNFSITNDFNLQSKPVFNLSKNGKNVIYIMLDRSTGVYFPYVLSLRPELKKIYSGFTFYKNTLSIGGNTIVGTPGAFGGYNYIPFEISKRSNKYLWESQNEALSIMPYNFSKAGFNVYLSDLPLKNYSTNGKKTPYESYKNLNETSLYDRSTFKYDYINVNSQIFIQKRNFVHYSIMSISPLYIRGILYHNGDYNYTEKNSFSEHFLRSFNVLRTLPDVTKISNDSSNNAIIIYNSITHNSTRVCLSRNTFLPITDEENPNYYYDDVDDGSGHKFDGDKAHLSVETSAYIQIGNFLKYLKNNGVYDNTRILIVADHGSSFGDITERFDVKVKHGDNFIGVSTTGYNPILLIKDFNSTGEIHFSDFFMTNADAPFELMKDVISQPYDPFNNTIITNEYKKGPIPIMWQRDWNELNNTEKQKFDGVSIIFHGNNIFSPKSWSYETDSYNKEVGLD